MIQIDTQYGTVDISAFSQDSYRTYLARKMKKRKTAKAIDRKLDFLIRDKWFIPLANYLQLQGFPQPNSTRILCAHGSNFNGYFTYMDSNKGYGGSRRVNYWMEEHDGKYDALAVFVCNYPDNYFRCNPQKSLVIYPVDKINVWDNSIPDACRKVNSGLLRTISPGTESFKPEIIIYDPSLYSN